MTLADLEHDLAGALGDQDGEFAMTIFRRHLPRLLTDLEKLAQLRQLITNAGQYDIPVESLRQFFG